MTNSRLSHLVSRGAGSVQGRDAQPEIRVARPHVSPAQDYKNRQDRYVGSDRSRGAAIGAAIGEGVGQVRAAVVGAPVYAGRQVYAGGKAVAQALLFGATFAATLTNMVVVKPTVAVIGKLASAVKAGVVVGFHAGKATVSFAAALVGKVVNAVKAGLQKVVDLAGKISAGVKAGASMLANTVVLAGAALLGLIVGIPAKLAALVRSFRRQASSAGVAMANGARDVARATAHPVRDAYVNAALSTGQLNPSQYPSLAQLFRLEQGMDMGTPVDTRAFSAFVATFIKSPTASFDTLKNLEADTKVHVTAILKARAELEQADRDATMAKHAASLLAEALRSAPQPVVEGDDEFHDAAEDFGVDGIASFFADRATIAAGANEGNKAAAAGLTRRASF